MDTYEESQRHPGDYEAQVSQRPIAVHALEHLGATDRGVTMFRKLVRQGIRAVTGGGPLQGLSREGAMIPTFCNDTVVRLPAAADAVEEKRLLRQTGRQIAESYLREPPLMPKGSAPRAIRPADAPA
jgi:hypothetical protein